LEALPLKNSGFNYFLPLERAECGLYLVGTFLVTMVGNVPLNDALAIADSNSAEGATLWAKYLTNWTFWNHVRTVAAIAAATLFAIALTKQ
jgi:uncharacterized membrane protein